MELVSLAQHSAWLGAGERPEKPSYSKRTARPQPRYMPACGAENGASQETAVRPGPATPTCQLIPRGWGRGRVRPDTQCFVPILQPAAAGTANSSPDMPH